MLTPQVLPMRTFSVKVLVWLLTAPDSTSKSAICVRAGGARSAIGAVFKLLFVGQPFGPGAAAPCVRFVAAIPAAASTSAAAVTISNGLTIVACQIRECQGNRSILNPLS